MKILNRIFEILKLRIKKKNPFAVYLLIIGLMEENKRLKAAIQIYAENNSKLVTQNTGLKYRIKECEKCENLRN